MKLKPGDKVRCINPGWGLENGQICTIKDIRDNGTICDVIYDTGITNNGLFMSRFELITSQENENMDTLNKLQNMELSPETRLLREYSILDTEGNLTTTGKDVLLHMLFNENEKKIVAKLKEVKTIDSQSTPKTEA